MSDSTFVGNLNDLINSVGVNLFEDEIAARHRHLELGMLGAGSFHQEGTRSE